MWCARRWRRCASRREPSPPRWRPVARRCGVSSPTEGCPRTLCSCRCKQTYSAYRWWVLLLICCVLDAKVWFVFSLLLVVPTFPILVWVGFVLLIPLQVLPYKMLNHRINNGTHTSWWDSKRCSYHTKAQQLCISQLKLNSWLCSNLIRSSAHSYACKLSYAKHGPIL